MGISEIMIGAQEQFTMLLQLSDLCWQAREKVVTPDVTFAKARETFKAIKIYVEWLEEFSVSVLPLEQSYYESVYYFINEYFDAEEYRC